VDQFKSSVFIATSLDGYIARKDGSLDWLDAASATVTKGEDCGYDNFINSVDALVMGRHSFEKVLSFGDWQYDKKVFVLSSVIKDVPNELTDKVEIKSGSPTEIVASIRARGYKNLYIDGGITIQRFLEEGLITNMTITVIPIILGGGIPLFGQRNRDIVLEHIASKSYDFGFVQSTYKVVN